MFFGFLITDLPFHVMTLQSVVHFSYVYSKKLVVFSKKWLDYMYIL